jgi:LITAF-like zinc ribbon domain
MFVVNAAYNPDALEGELVVDAQPTPIVFGPKRIEITCPKCNNEVVTRLDFEIGKRAWLAFGILCISGYVVIWYYIRHLK